MISPKLPKSAPQWQKIQWKFWINYDFKSAFYVIDRLQFSTTSKTSSLNRIGLVSCFCFLFLFLVSCFLRLISNQIVWKQSNVLKCAATSGYQYPNVFLMFNLSFWLVFALLFSVDNVRGGEAVCRWRPKSKLTILNDYFAACLAPGEDDIYLEDPD